jgi:hypothetical protein
VRSVAAYMRDPFLKEFTPGDVVADQVRHPVAHGSKLAGTRIESLACFLLLDAIVGLLALCRERLRERITGRACGPSQVSMTCGTTC